MKTVFPGRTELALLIAMAILGGTLVAVARQTDTMLFFVTLPVFLIPALMGFRRSLAVRPVEIEKADDSESGRS
jgi:hypothetical protein